MKSFLFTLVALTTFISINAFAIGSCPTGCCWQDCTCVCPCLPSSATQIKNQIKSFSTNPAKLDTYLKSLGYSSCGTNTYCSSTFKK